MKEKNNASLEEIFKKLNEIESNLSELKKSTDRMDRHIDFVDNVFDLVRKPFFLLMNTVNMILLPDDEKREHNHVDYVFIKDGK